MCQLVYVWSLMIKQPVAKLWLQILWYMMSWKNWNVCLSVLIFFLKHVAPFFFFLFENLLLNFCCVYYES